MDVPQQNKSFATANSHESDFAPGGNSIQKHGATTAPNAFTNYEEALARDPRWALSEGSRHFDEKSAVFDALHKIAQRLSELQIPYAIVGGMALFHHGLRRFT